MQKVSTYQMITGIKRLIPKNVPILIEVISRNSPVITARTILIDPNISQLLILGNFDVSRYGLGREYQYLLHYSVYEDV
tara:strand:- start:47 stop:283 length:237 start_codon:yes stop_codon:yes gene_type:complete